VAGGAMAGAAAGGGLSNYSKDCDSLVAWMPALLAGVGAFLMAMLKNYVFTSQHKFMESFICAIIAIFAVYGGGLVQMNVNCTDDGNNNTNG
jgi:hypothetical protein